MKNRVLVVDDDSGQRSLLRSFLEQNSCRVDECKDGLEAMEVVQKDPTYALILCDVQMPNCDGFSFLKKMKSQDIHIPVILITGYADVKHAVKAMEWGAESYLEKPIDLDELGELMNKKMPELKGDHRRSGMEHDLEINAIVESEEMLSLYQDVKTVAPSMARVLLTGESGCGKEVVARHLHDWSERGSKEMKVVNCAAIPENLMESELFGHEKGAFTGADSKRVGCFELANGSTLFLDEIGEMPMACQAKLLRVLQDGWLTPVGSTKGKQVDVRVISATNRNLEQEIEKGNFREDLYYRLNVIELYLPPLRERLGDVLPLAKFFAGHFNRDGKCRLSKGFEKSILEYRWPGNVRELQNVMERAVLLSKGGVLMPEHLPRKMFKVKPRSSIASLSESKGDGSGQELFDSVPDKSSLQDMETKMLIDMLLACHGNRSESARKLGISRRTLLYKIKKLEDRGVEVPKPGA